MPLSARPYLRGDPVAADRAAPDRFARPPVRGDARAACHRRSRSAACRRAVAVHEAVRYSSPSRTTHSRSVRHRPGLSRPDSRPRRSQRCSSTAAATAASTAFSSRIRRHRLKTIGIFLGDEAGRKPPFPPARMAHQRGQERHVVLDAVDDEAVERIRHRIDRLSARRRPGAELGDHRIVEHRDLRPLRRRRCRCAR